MTRLRYRGIPYDSNTAKGSVNLDGSILRLGSQTYAVRRLERSPQGSPVPRWYRGVRADLD